MPAWCSATCPAALDDAIDALVAKGVPHATAGFRDRFRDVASYADACCRPLAARWMAELTSTTTQRAAAGAVAAASVALAAFAPFASRVRGPHSAADDAPPAARRSGP